MKHFTHILGAAIAAATLAGPALAQDTVLVPCVCELSGAGAVSGSNYRDGAKLAVEEINANGGVLGKQL